jgi:hypothetical protein
MAENDQYSKDPWSNDTLSNYNSYFAIGMYWESNLSITTRKVENVFGIL